MKMGRDEPEVFSPDQTDNVLYNESWIFAHSCLRKLALYIFLSEFIMEQFWHRIKVLFFYLSRVVESLFSLSELMKRVNQTVEQTKGSFCKQQQQSNTYSVVLLLIKAVIFLSLWKSYGDEWKSNHLQTLFLTYTRMSSSSFATTKNLVKTGDPGLLDAPSSRLLQMRYQSRAFLYAFCGLLLTLDTWAHVA